MSTVQQAIEVSAPLHMVYERFANFDSYPQFMTGVEQITPVSHTTAHMVMDLDGQRREFDAEITECRTDERVVWQATDGPMMAEVIMLRPVDGNRTHIIAQLEADVQALMPGDSHAQEALNRRLKADLASFKRYIERDTVPTPAAMPATRSMRATATDTGATLGAGEDAAMGSALLGAPGTGAARAGSRVGNGRTGAGARDMDLDMDTDLDLDRDMATRRSTGMPDIEEDMGGTGRM